MTMVRLAPAAPRSRVKHSTPEPLRSLAIYLVKLQLTGNSLASFCNIVFRYWFNGNAGVLVWVKNMGLLLANNLRAFHWYVFSLVNLKYMGTNHISPKFSLVNLKYMGTNHISPKFSLVNLKYGGTNHISPEFYWLI